jgi:hypothetical protein
MENKSCIIVGGGYSILDGINLGLWSKIKGQDIWSINYAWKTMPYLPSREVFLDVSFYKNNTPDLQKLFSQGVPIHTKKHNTYAFNNDIIKYETTRLKEQIESKVFIGLMGLSGVFALSLACRENFEQIFLLGYDFGSVTNDIKTHYYQYTNHFDSGGVGQPGVYSTDGKIKPEVKDFDIYERIYPNCKIYNVSPLSKIPYFEKISYQDLFSIYYRKEL